MKSLTGGTGDVNPQFLNVTVTQNEVNSLAKVYVPLPITKRPGTGNRVTVMEILKIFLVWDEYPILPVASAITVALIYGGIFIGKQATLKHYSDWSVLAAKYTKITGAFTAGGTFITQQEMPFVFDLTDNMGHGVLVATDTITAQCYTAGQIALYSVFAKILYRFKNVGMVEYLGILQSQQQT